MSIGDWYDKARAERAAWGARASSPISSTWSRHPLVGDPARDMYAILASGRNVARVQGASANLRIRLATDDAIGTAAAGFEDAPESFKRPYIVIDRSIYASSPLEWALDISLGVILHEVGHILHTREFYRRLAAGGVSARMKGWANMVEDERIEDLIIDASPGFKPYLCATRRHILEDGSFREAIAGWAELGPLDRLNVLVFGFIRAPHLLGLEMECWTVCSGEVPFLTLRAILAEYPRDETAVWTASEAIEALWSRVRELYSGPGADPDDPDTQRQARDDREDEALTSDWVARVLEEAESLARAGCPGKADQYLDEAIAQIDRGEVADPGDSSGEVRRGRFGSHELFRQLGRTETIRNAFRPEEIERIERIERSLPDLDEGPLNGAAVDQWDWKGESRATILEEPRADADAVNTYEDARAIVRPHVVAMRNVFRFLQGEERPSLVRETMAGRIDPRRLALARTTDRVFCRRETIPTSRLVIGLLLDASGSMSLGSGLSKDVVALRGAVLIAEALRGVDTVTLQVWSHTSTGPDDADCVVRHLYGPGLPDRYALGTYRGEANNYDHAAVATVDRLLREGTARDTARLLIVLSDGAPVGQGYGGESAIEATRKAVVAARARGTRVLNVAIEDYASEAIFGSAHVVKFTDLDRLVVDLRRLITRLVTSGGR